MITRGVSLFSRAAAIFAIFSLLTACGGGGGGGDGGFYNGGGGGGGTTDIEMVLLDENGNETKTVITSAQLKVTVKSGGDNVLVSVATDIGEISPASGTALTNGDGVATFTVIAGNVRGAGTITATAQREDGTTATGSLAFQVGAVELRMGYFDADGTFLENQIEIIPAGTLSQGGNAQLSVVILDKDGNRVATVQEVSFVSGCLTAGQATSNPANPVPSVNGRSSTLYTVAGCAGIDQITASLPGSSGQALGTLNIAPASTKAVSFVSAVPNLIVLRGTGGQNRDETADVVFRVVDTTGAPLPGVNVEFDLSTFVGGLTLSKQSSLSDGDGQVSVTVAAGDVATTVRVIATVVDNGQEISTASDLLTVTTGLPDANSISLSIDKFVVNGGIDTDGLLRTVNVRMADKFNNPVVDGTAAVFTTEYGAIIGSCATVDGGCSVQWNSQEPRYPTLTGDDFVRRIDEPGYSCPTHNGNSGPCPDDLGYIRGGLYTILVHAIGEESFVDQNGNGVMDEAERDLFDNLTEAFIDHNEDLVYTPALPACLANPMGSLQCIAGQEETFVDFNNNNLYDLNDDPPLYNGLLCPLEGDGVWCSRQLLHVWDEVPVVLADDVFFVTATRVQSGTDAVVTTLNFGAPHIVYIADIHNNPPEAGTSVSVSVSGTCDLETDGGFTMRNQAGPGAWGIPVTVVQPPQIPAEPEQGKIRISLSGPGLDSSESVIFDCPTVAPPDPNAP